MNDLSNTPGDAALNTSPESLSRRHFLRRSGQLGLAGTAMPFALNLAAMGEAASEGADAAEARGSDESSARRLVGYNSIVNHDPIVAVLALQ